MKRRFVVLATFAVLACCCSISRANILSLVSTNDGDGAIACEGYFDSVNAVLTIEGPQYWSPGHMLGTITTDTTNDPSLTLRTTVDNDTGIDWTGYHVNVYMTNTFTISNAQVFTPGDWSIAITQQPIFNGTQWEGQIDLAGGTVITNGTLNALDFSYKITFSGGTQYAFTQEMIVVPEPGTAGLVTLSGLLLGWFTFVRGTRRT